MATALPLHVSGNKIKDNQNRDVRLMGVNIMGMEYSCVQSKGFLDKSANLPASVASVNGLKTWGINAVRLPLNEHCALGINGTPSGTSYMNSLKSYVDIFVDNDIWVILDLQWSAPAGQVADNLDGMPNTSYSANFWSLMCDWFGTHINSKYGAVIFDLFNEPRPNNNPNDDTDTVARQMWECWRDGGATFCQSAVTSRAGTLTTAQCAGMQSLVTAIRNTPAQNIIMLGGPRWANTLYSSSTRNINIYKPTDPLGQLIASSHIYNDTWILNSTGAAAEFPNVISQMPVVLGEHGDRGNSSSNGAAVPMAQWMLDNGGSGNFPWAWEAPAGGQLNLINATNQYTSGTPSPYGQGFKDWNLANPYVPAGGGTTPTDADAFAFTDTAFVTTTTPVATDAWAFSESAVKFSPAGAYATEVMADNPMLYWRLGETSGTVAQDETVNGKTGTYTGSPTLGVASLLSDTTNKAVTVSGTGQYITRPDDVDLHLTGTTPFSLECIFKPSIVDTTFRRIMSRENAGITDGYYIFYHSTQGFRFTRAVAAGGGNTVISGIIPVVGTKYHIVCTYDGTNLRMYIDGVQVGGNVASAGSALDFAGTFDVGRRSGATDNAAGTIDEVTIHSAVLSQARVTAHFNAMNYVPKVGPRKASAALIGIGRF